MGRPRLGRQVVTHSLGKDTVKRIDLLRDHEQNRIQERKTRVTLSEIVDDAIRLLDRHTFMSDEDPTKNGKWFEAWMGTEEWRCPSCVDAQYNEGEPPSLAGGWIICPYVKCLKPRPTASYPEPLPDDWKILEACIPCGTHAKVVQVEPRDY